MHASICDIVLDCFQNSIEAGSSIIGFNWIEENDRVTVELNDNGRGMSAEVLASCVDPWFTDGVKHKNRKVGLGLPFLYQTVEATDGKILLESNQGEGTRLKFSLNLKHIDSPALGDLVGTLVSCFLFPGKYEVLFDRERILTDGRVLHYRLSRHELLDVLGSFEDISNLSLLKDFIESQEESIKE